MQLVLDGKYAGFQRSLTGIRTIYHAAIRGSLLKIDLRRLMFRRNGYLSPCTPNHQLLVLLGHVGVKDTGDAGLLATFM